MHIKVREALIKSKFLTQLSRPFKMQLHILPLPISRHMKSPSRKPSKILGSHNSPCFSLSLGNPFLSLLSLLKSNTISSNCAGRNNDSGFCSLTCHIALSQGNSFILLSYSIYKSISVTGKIPQRQAL